MALVESTGVTQVTEKDSIGNSKFSLDSGVYDFTIKSMYPVKNKGGSASMQLVLETADKKLFNPCIYFMDKEGSMTTISNWGDTKGKKVDTFGKQQLDAICRMAVGKSLVEVSASEEKKTVIKQFTKDEKQEVMMYMDVVLPPAKIKLAILETKVNKQAQDGQGKYVPINEERIENTISKIFSAEGFTKEELDKKLATPVFIEAWKEKFEGKLQDKFKAVAGGAVSGSPVMSENKFE
jgi:hypothetical protein